jgi:hypothetical protein
MSKTRGRGRLNAFLSREEKSPFEGNLDFARRFLAGVTVRHDVRPLDNLRNVTIVSWLR